MASWDGRPESPQAPGHPQIRGLSHLDRRRPLPAGREPLHQQVHPHLPEHAGPQGPGPCFDSFGPQRPQTRRDRPSEHRLAASISNPTGWLIRELLRSALARMPPMAKPLGQGFGKRMAAAFNRTARGMPRPLPGGRIRLPPRTPLPSGHVDPCSPPHRPPPIDRSFEQATQGPPMAQRFSPPSRLRLTTEATPAPRRPNAHAGFFARVPSNQKTCRT